MAPAAINHVSVSVTDMAASVAFYTEFLGLAVVPSPSFGMPVTWLRAGSISLHLFERPTVVAPYHHVAFTIDDLVGLRSQAVARGIVPTEPPFDQVTLLPDGSAQMYVTDPGGNLVELDQPDARDLPLTMRVLTAALPQSATNLRASLYP